MAKRKAKKKKDPRKVHGKVDPVRVQVAIKVADVPGLRSKISPAFLRAAMLQYVETGRPPRGVEIDAIDWINPSRVHPELAVWKSSKDADQSLPQARATLRRLLRRLRFNFRRI